MRTRHAAEPFHFSVSSLLSREASPPPLRLPLPAMSFGAPSAVPDGKFNVRYQAGQFSGGRLAGCGSAKFNCAGDMGNLNNATLYAKTKSVVGQTFSRERRDVSHKIVVEPVANSTKEVRWPEKDQMGAVSAQVREREALAVLTHYPSTGATHKLLRQRSNASDDQPRLPPPAFHLPLRRASR